MISGLEEARLIFAAVRSSVVIDPAPALCIDIGGGSVELMIGDAAGLRWADERARSASAGSPPSSSTTTRRRRAERKRLEEHIREALEPLLPDVVSRVAAACASARAARSTISRAWPSR